MFQSSSQPAVHDLGFTAKHTLRFYNPKMAIKSILRNFKSMAINSYKYLIGVIATILAIPIGTVIFVPFILYRRLVFHCGRIFRSDLGKMVSSRGTMFLSEDVYKSPRYKLVMGGVLQGVLSLQEIQANTLDIAQDRDSTTGELKYPEMQQQIENWMGYRFWKPLENFKIENHVSALNDTTLTQEEVTQYMKSESLISFPEGSALWKILLVPNFTPDKSAYYYKEGEKYSCIIFMVHHAVCDGFSAAKMLHKVCKSDYEHPNMNSSPSGSAFERFKNTMLSVSRVPYDIGDLIVSTSYEKMIWKKSSIPLSNIQVKPKMSPIIANLIGQPCQEKFYYIHSFSELLLFSDIRKISKIHDVATFAVVLAAIAGAIRSVMFKSSKRMPQSINLPIPFPVPGHPDKLRNHMCGLTISLPIGESNPIKQLRIINSTVQNLKQSTIPLVANLLTLAYCSFPPILLLVITKLSHLPNVASLSSFPGPKQEVTLNGCNLKESYWMTSALAGSKALGFGFTTYAGYGRLSIQADGSIIGSEDVAEELVRTFSKHLDLLRTMSLNSNEV